MNSLPAKHEAYAISAGSCLPIVTCLGPMIDIIQSKNLLTKFIQLYLTSQLMHIQRVTYPYQKHATNINYNAGIHYSNQSRPSSFRCLNYAETYSAKILRCSMTCSGARFIKRRTTRRKASLVVTKSREETKMRFIKKRPCTKDKK